MKVVIRFWATTDLNTYLNMINHAYFNLAGSGNVLQHQLSVSSETILETNEFYIPSGNLIPVKDTVFDFTQMKPIGERIHELDLKLIWNKGYKHCYLLDKQVDDGKLPLAATLLDPLSGRQLKLYTSLQSLLIYSAGYLNSSLPGKSGACYQPCDGVCLEAQYYPDSPHHPHFPTCLLPKDEIYNHSIEYHFS